MHPRSYRLLCRAGKGGRLGELIGGTGYQDIKECTAAKGVPGFIATWVASEQSTVVCATTGSAGSTPTSAAWTGLITTENFGVKSMSTLVNTPSPRSVGNFTSIATRERAICLLTAEHSTCLVQCEQHRPLNLNFTTSAGPNSQLPGVGAPSTITTHGSFGTPMMQPRMRQGTARRRDFSVIHSVPLRIAVKSLTIFTPDALVSIPTIFPITAHQKVILIAKIMEAAGAISGHGEALFKSPILSLPTELLQICFELLVSYTMDPVFAFYDRHPAGHLLMRISRTSLTCLANIARACKKFHGAILPLIYRHVDSGPGLGTSGESTLLLLRTLSERPDIAELVRSLRVESFLPDLPGRVASWEQQFHAHNYANWTILIVIQQYLRRARLPIPGCRIEQDSLRKLNLASLQYLMIESDGRSLGEGDNPLGAILRCAPNLTTLILKRINPLFLMTTKPHQPAMEHQHLVSLTILDCELFFPGSHSRVNPSGPTHYADLAQDAAPWERCEYPPRYASLAVAHFNISAENLALARRPVNERGRKVYHGGLSFLDELRASPSVSTTLKAIHLGEYRQLRYVLLGRTSQTTDNLQSGPSQPTGSLPNVTFLSIHCLNFVLNCHNDPRNIVTEIFDICPRLESLEVTGVHLNLRGTWDKVLDLARYISHRYHDQTSSKNDCAHLSLKKLTICSEEDVEEPMWLRFMCAEFRAHFEGTGIKLDFVRRIKDA
ncbi:hypothetical protein V8F20_006405 [Naviculisporaceae sp. PSN 640]